MDFQPSICLSLYSVLSSTSLFLRRSSIPGVVLGSRAGAALVSDDQVSPTLSCPGPIGATSPSPIWLFLALCLESWSTLGQFWKGRRSFLLPCPFLGISLHHEGQLLKGRRSLFLPFLLVCYFPEEAPESAHASPVVHCSGVIAAHVKACNHLVW